MSNPPGAIQDGASELEPKAPSQSEKRQPSNFESLRKAIVLHLNEHMTPQKMINRFISSFPIIGYLRSYNKETAIQDLSSGFTVAVMLLPQAIAYAIIATVPPVYGLYSSILPLIIYGLLGSSRELAVGPVAIASSLVASAIDTIDPSLSPAARVPYAIALSILVGLLQLGMGFLNLGFVVRFLSHSVISGFTGASAIIIGLSQAKQVLGISNLTRSNYFHVIVEDIVLKIGKTQWQAVVVTAVTAFLLVQLPKINKKIAKLPIALIVLSIGTLISYLVDFKSYKISVIGTIPSDLPKASLPDFSLLSKLVVPAFTIALVAFLESIAVAQALAMKAGYKVDASQELVALGASNIVGSFFSAFPVTGGFSRSAVQAQSGSKTPLVSIIVGMLMLIFIVSIAPALYYLPQACLAALILVAVSKLLIGAIHELRHMLAIFPRDCLVGTVCFICTLFLGVEDGILIGFALSIVLVIREASFPHFAVLGRITASPARVQPRSAFAPNVDVPTASVVLEIEANPQAEGNVQNPATATAEAIGDDEAEEEVVVLNEEQGFPVFRNVKRFPFAHQDPQFLILRFDSSLFFGNVEHFLNSVHSSIAAKRLNSDSSQLKYLILDFSSINSIDFAGVEAILELEMQLRSSNMHASTLEIVFHYVHGPVQDVMKRVPSLKKALEVRGFDTFHECIQFCKLNS